MRRANQQSLHSANGEDPGDAEALQRILDEYRDSADAVEGEGIGAELIRVIRQISLATKEFCETLARQSSTSGRCCCER